MTVKQLFKILHDFRKSPDVSDIDRLIPFIKKGIIALVKPSTSSSDMFKQQSIYKFTSVIKPKDTFLSAPAASPKIKFLDTESLSNDHNGFNFTQNVKIFNENPGKIVNEESTKPQTSRQSLLDSLDDDFKK